MNFRGSKTWRAAFVGTKLSCAGFVIAAAAIALTPNGAQAQSAGGMGGAGGIANGGGMGGGHSHQQKADTKPAEQKPKVDDKAYAAALKGLPDKKYDPWQGKR